MQSEYIIEGPQPTTHLDGKTLGNVFYNALLKYIDLPDAVKNKPFIDEAAVGANTREKAKIVMEQVIAFLRKGGFGIAVATPAHRLHFLLMQSLWDTRIGWDDLLPPETLGVNVHTEQRVSYEKMLTYSCRFAQAMVRWGLSSKDIIVIISENNEQYCIPILSGLYAGIATAPLNNNYTKRELCNLIEIIEPTMVLCSNKSLDKALFLKSKYCFIKKLLVIDVAIDSVEAESFEIFIGKYSDKDFDAKQYEPASFDSDEQIAFVMCSSGTTGPPKAVALSHTNGRIRLIHSQDTVFTPMLPKGSTVLQVLPMYHALGLSMTLSYLLTGYSVIMMEKFEHHLFLNAMESYKVTYTTLVPSLFVFLAKSPLVSNYDLSNLHYLGSGGAPLNKELCEVVLEKFKNLKILQGYGLTESSSAIIISHPTESKLGSIGKVGPLVTAKVRNPDTGEILGPNEVGELCFKGPSVMKGYIKNQEATKEIIDESGWLHSGDVGYFDVTQDFYIVDRLKDLIKYNGFQVSPSELEQVLLEHPKVQDVAIVGISDEIAGELPTACVVVCPGSEMTKKEVTDFVVGKVSYPKYIRGGVYFLDCIPKTGTGKTNRNYLKKLIETKKGECAN